MQFCIQIYLILVEFQMDTIQIIVFYLVTNLSNQIGNSEKISKVKFIIVVEIYLINISANKF